MSFNRILERFKESIKANQFNAIKLSLSSPEQIRSLSYGEVKKIETINYRTLKPERDGLFCPRIFGPVQDWCCICGKYKRMKHRGIVCEKCGVEVIESRVRRERMGHIELVAPVVHMWYLRGTPSYLALILDLSVKNLERVIYFEAYIVISDGKSPYRTGSVITPAEREIYEEKHSDDYSFEVGMGAEAIKKILEMIDLELELTIMREEYRKSSSVLTKVKIMKRIKVFSGLSNAKIKPEWMILTAMPVLPPDLRPLVALDGGRFASSDLNELYRRVINRNIRLKRLIEIQAPSVIIKNEKRMLQESVDALIDNGKKAQPVRVNKRPLKSLSEMLRGKQGRFRQNLLGKRVDYSGRSVIVVDPELKIDQCGLPKLMALELFKSHVLCELIKRQIAPNIRVARKIVENMDPVAWDVLEDIVKDYPIILNRAPTLHRLGIQGFYPILVETKAIKIHPMVTGAYNADFDGDQMGVYIPLSKNAILECRNLIMSSKNLLSSQNARPVATPSQDMVFGLHYLTKMRCNVKGENACFSSIDELITAYECNALHVHASIKLRTVDGRLVETTVGRAVLLNALPIGSNIDWVNKIMNAADMAKMVELVYFEFGREKTIIMLDKIKYLGFGYATSGGISFSYEHLISPNNRSKILAEAEKSIEKIEYSYKSGDTTGTERYNKILQIWDSATKDVAADMMQDLESANKIAFENKNGENIEFNFLFMALDSRARGSKDQIKQLVGMRGLMSKPSGEIMETPVKSNFKLGLSVFEYFISTHGARKGQADTALKTANAGYLTRRLVDVAQDVIITIDDCRTTEYLEFEDLTDSGDVIITLAQRVYGKVAMEDIRDLITKELLVSHGSLITRADTEKIRNAAVTKIKVRSVVKCKTKRGVCAKCYGMDLSKDRLIEIGVPVGIIAAQSIGEPGTQLTMRTFHIGGTANLGDKLSFVAKHDGIIKFENIKIIKNRHGEKLVIARRSRLIILSPDGRELQKHYIEYGSIVNVDNGELVKREKILVEWDPNNRVVVNEAVGNVFYNDIIQNITVQNRYDETTNKLTTIVLDQRSEKHQPSIIIKNNELGEEINYYLPGGSIINVDQNQHVFPGDIIAKMPREASKTKDITGGLPRIAELFEARMPKDPCIIAEIDGIISLQQAARGMRKIIITGERVVEYVVPRNKQLNVVDGDHVQNGDLITNGAPVLHDMLNIIGIDYTQYYLVNQIQSIYKSQGVNINDRHFELIVRQMTRKARIVESGDTSFLVGDKVDRIHLSYINNALESENKKICKFKPVLMGITLASLDTESFISAASFQETTRILSEAAMCGQQDHLYGLKENVIIGKLIPAGTGIEEFRKNYL